MLLLFWNPWLLWLLILCLQKFCWVVFLVNLLVDIYVVYVWKIFSCGYLQIFFHMSFIQSKFSIIIYYCFYTIFSMGFSACINHIYIIYFTAFSGYLISSLISLYSLNTLFTETNRLWLIYESIKALEIKTLIIFSLVFANNTILSCFFFLLLMLTYTFYSYC